jgi:hypothetical protein
MTLARASDGLVRGGWRSRVRFRFVGRNFLRRSVSIFAVMMFVLPKRFAVSGEIQTQMIRQLPEYRTI